MEETKLKLTLAQSHDDYYGSELFDTQPLLHDKVIVRIEDPYYNRTGLSIGKIGIVDTQFNFVRTGDGHYVTYREVVQN